MRKLQISLPDFRRLCIFKGIYPREPRNKKKVSKSSTPSTTFYYTKDVQYLLHEPLLARFRDHKALSKKIAKSLGRGEVGDAARLEKHGGPKLTLDHVIKERYPTFVDALRDLDDALSLLSLFANLPSTANVPGKTIQLCQRLCLEFQHYLIKTNSLRKSFLSIKGIYYQATIQGQDILWLVPYKFVQRVTGDVDFRIMGTFVEFYTTLLGFVNFRLYTSVGLVYPPKFDSKSDEQGGELSAFTLEGRNIEGTDQSKEPATNGDGAAPQTNGVHEIPAEVQRQIDSIQEPPQNDNEVPSTTDHVSSDTLDDAAPPTDTIDTFRPITQDADVLPQPAPLTTQTSTLFAPFTFYLSRETPRQPLEFLLRAFGCTRVGWDSTLGSGAFTANENDPSITHQIVDRPPISTSTVDDATGAMVSSGAMRMPGRTYVQPQWVWDCINEVRLLRPDLYASGATLPPHLSPFVKPSKGGYDPTAPLAEQEREGEAEDDEDLAAVEDAEEDESTPPIAMGKAPADDEAILSSGDEAEKDPHGMAIATCDDSLEDDDDDDDESDDFAGFESEANDSDTGLTPELLHQRELEAEATGGVPVNGSSSAKKGILKNSGSAEADTEAKKQRSKARQRKQREEDEELERRKMMLGRKKRQLVEKMMYGNKMRDAEAEQLRRKRRKMERSKS